MLTFLLSLVNSVLLFFVASVGSNPYLLSFVVIVVVAMLYAFYSADVCSDDFISHRVELAYEQARILRYMSRCVDTCLYLPNLPSADPVPNTACANACFVGKKSIGLTLGKGATSASEHLLIAVGSFYAFLEAFLGPRIAGPWFVLKTIVFRVLKVLCVLIGIEYPEFLL